MAIVLLLYAFINLFVISTDAIGSCENGGTLNDFGRRCDCPLGYRGERCEKPKCKSGGQTQGEDGQYFCDCWYSWKGEFCETSKCIHGSMSSNGSCVCKEKFFGDWCNSVSDCGAHGRLIFDGFCHCDQYWTGPICDQCMFGTTSYEDCNATKAWFSWEPWTSWSEPSEIPSSSYDSDSSDSSEQKMEPLEFVLIAGAAIVITIVVAVCSLLYKAKKRRRYSSGPPNRVRYDPAMAGNTVVIMPPPANPSSAPYPPPALGPTHFPEPSAPVPNRQISSPPDYKDVESVPPSYEAAVTHHSDQ